MQIIKNEDENYNENEYIDNYLKNKNMDIEGDIVNVDGWKFTIDREVLKIQENLLEEIDTSIPYEGLGYKFIYDGSLNEAGNTGANMCNNITGGWTEKRTTYTYNGDNSYYNGWLYTNNEIDLSEYSKLYAIRNVVGETDFSYIYGSKTQYTLQGGNGPNIVFYGKNNEGRNIPENWKGYIGIHSLHSKSNTYYYDYTKNYVRNYTNASRYIDVYEIIAVKEDNWKNWIKIARLDNNEKNYNTLEEVINNKEILNKLFNNNEANEYLLKCSGTLMVELLKKDIAFNEIPDTLKEKMKNNENWSKFATIYKRTL
ncbi:MAG: hypothetical protein HFJ42_03220 [Clostridia bacterium]|nr:hypothetical protein [Clostridia bacterium]